MFPLPLQVTMKSLEKLPSGQFAVDRFINNGHWAAHGKPGDGPPRPEQQ